MRYLLLASLCTAFAAPALAQHGHHHSDATIPDVPIKAYDEGTQPKPEGYDSPGKPPKPGKAIRKVADDHQDKPQTNFGTLFTNDNEWFAQALVDRLEYRDIGEEEVVLWDADFWVGGDYNKLYLESEGEWNLNGTTESATVEAFWNHTIASFWDTQLGIRHDFKPEDSRSFLAAGVQGMAPYVFEVDATAYVSEEGDPSAVLELERDFYFTQRLAVQPRLETEFAFTDVPEYDTGAGFTYVEAGLRMRYEITRKFAPYIGVSWEQNLGATKNMIEANGEDPSNTAFVAGLQMWF